MCVYAFMRVGACMYVFMQVAVNFSSFAFANSCIRNCRMCFATERLTYQRWLASISCIHSDLRAYDLDSLWMAALVHCVLRLCSLLRDMWGSQFELQLGLWW